MAIPAFTPRSDWKLPDLTQLPSWADAKRVCVDLETKDPQLKKLGPGVRRDGKIVGFGFAIDGGPKAYLPIAHANGTNLDPKHVLQYFLDQAKCFTGELVGANLPYDLDYMAESKIVFRNVSFFRDIQVAEPLIDENQFSYSMENIAKRRGIAGKDEILLRAAAASWGVDPKAGMWELPPEFVGHYGEQDCLLPLEILRAQEKEIDALDLREVYDMESRLLPVLLKMRRRGVRVDFDHLDRVAEWATEREVSALARINHLTGCSLTTSDTTKTSALIPVLEHMGINFNKPEYRTDPTDKFPKGQPSIKNDWLKTLPKNDIVEAILDAKKFNKLNGTFVKSIRTHAIGDRIHCTLKQMIGESEDGETGGAKYGRLACSGPNLQQQPARDPEIGPMWRAIYIPDEGGTWAVHDYSQQEPRWLVHYAELMKLPKARAMAERYRTDPTADNHDMMATLINSEWPNLAEKFKKAERSAAKIIFLGLCYGMGPGKLAKSLGLPTKWREFKAKDGRTVKYLGAGDEAQALLEKFRNGVPFVKKLMKLAEEAAEERGYIKTVDGRKCHFPKVWDPAKRKMRYDLTHKAGNRLVQGSAGGQMKTAMVKADAEDIRLQLQVHDELSHTIWDPEESLHCARVMRGAVKCNVPHKVDIETGPNWGDISEPEWAK